MRWIVPSKFAAFSKDDNSFLFRDSRPRSSLSYVLFLEIRSRHFVGHFMVDGLVKLDEDLHYRSQVSGHVSSFTVIYKSNLILYSYFLVTSL